MDSAAQLGATVRGLVQLGAGALATNGVIAESDVQQAVAATMFLLTLAWSYWQKVRQSKAVEIALNTMPPGAGGFSSSNSSIQAPVEVRGVQGVSINPPPGACE